MLNKINKLIIFSALIFILPCFANAQSLSLISDKSTYIIGEDVSVVLNLDTSGELINVVDGTVSFPTEFFDIQSIKTGDSFLTLWPERPTLSDDGTIAFTGGVPHGFNGSNGNVFSFTLKPKKIGEAIISISSATNLLNNGLGTKLDGVALVPLKIAITSPTGIIVKPQLVIDKIKPLPFTPIISKNPSVAQNRFFVSFSTVDKETGVSYYEVREEYVLVPFFGPWMSTNWQKSETPYILKLQHWWSKIYIRAYDGAGNFTEEIAVKPMDKEGYIVLKIIILIIGVILLFFAVCVYFKFINRKNKSRLFNRKK